ncbi:LINE-1 reverse transcriptase isogeny [Sesbania bispinosa]|nr:LINE-1 reverse transcriptase isogeny [Sesbania bispinosa]
MTSFVQEFMQVPISCFVVFSGINCLNLERYSMFLGVLLGDFNEILFGSEQRGDGEWCSDGDILEREASTFFKRMFCTRDASGGPIPTPQMPKLTDDNIQTLTSPVSKEEARDLLLPAYKMKLGNGEASFWYDDWTGDGPLGSKVWVVNIHDLAAHVRDVWMEEGWRWDSLWTSVSDEVRDLVRRTRVFLYPDLTDQFVWSPHLTEGIKTGGTLFLATLWEVWTIRNKLVFYGVVPLPWQICLAARNLASSIRRAFQSSQTEDAAPKWIGWDVCSPTHFILNTDGSFVDGIAGVGGLIRKSDGSWVQGFCGHFGQADIIETELMDIWLQFFEVPPAGLSHLLLADASGELYFRL